MVSTPKGCDCAERRSCDLFDPMSVLAYITDLFFQAKVGQTAQSVGVKVKIVSSLYHFLPQLKEKPSLVLIDLNADGISPSTLIAQIKEKNPELPVVAYGAHVQTELLERARKSGADSVLPRSKLSSDLPKILTRYAKKREPG